MASTTEEIEDPGQEKDQTSLLVSVSTNFYSIINVKIQGGWLGRWLGGWLGGWVGGWVGG